MKTETKVQHTPGPWKATRADIHGDDPDRWAVVLDGEQEFFVATIENGAPGDCLKTEEANARLIAAAPELLESLKLCAAKLQIFLDEVSAVNGHGFPEVEKIEKDAYAAIAKAEGRA